MVRSGRGVAVGTFGECHPEPIGNSVPYTALRTWKRHFWGTASCKPEHAHIQRTQMGD